MNGKAPGARRALLDAFAELALSRRYQEISVGLLTRQANVARSTFYYHFKVKDDLLVQNLAPMISVLASLPAAHEVPADLADWVAHIWEHRARAGRIFDGPAGRKLADALTLELRSTLGAMDIRASPLLADQLAGATLSLLRAWTAGRGVATPSEIATMLWSGARRLAEVKQNSRVPPTER
ncbi:MAG TPA: TetR family transcriptional regulator [Caulobacteraceae bacterium]|nr:TetR family transcriptional regulator [Caulobacteraceae bacterium]